MRLVIIESPFSGDIPRNVRYALECVRDSVCRGESPYASHIMLPGALNDSDPDERYLGIRCGYEWWRAASLVAFYTDLGWSKGMQVAYKRARQTHMAVEERSLEDYKNGNYAAGVPVA